MATTLPPPPVLFSGLLISFPTIRLFGAVVNCTVEKVLSRAHKRRKKRVHADPSVKYYFFAFVVNTRKYPSSSGGGGVERFVLFRSWCATYALIHFKDNAANAANSPTLCPGLTSIRTDPFCFCPFTSIQLPRLVVRRQKAPRRKKKNPTPIPPPPHLWYWLYPAGSNRWAYPLQLKQYLSIYRYIYIFHYQVPGRNT